MLAESQLFSEMSPWILHWSSIFSFQALLSQPQVLTICKALTVCYQVSLASLSNKQNKEYDALSDLGITDEVIWKIYFTAKSVSLQTHDCCTVTIETFWFMVLRSESLFHVVQSTVWRLRGARPLLITVRQAFIFSIRHLCLAPIPCC